MLQIKKGYTNKLKKYGFMYDAIRQEYFLPEIENEIKILIPKSREILIYTQENICGYIPDIILKMFQDNIIEVKHDYFECFQAIKTKKEKPIKILEEINGVVIKKTMNLKSFEYRDHPFYLRGTIKTGYEIGDVLTGCLIDIKIEHIKELPKIEPRLDTFLSTIALSSRIYSEKIDFFINVKEM